MQRLYEAGNQRSKQRDNWIRWSVRSFASHLLHRVCTTSPSRRKSGPRGVVWGAGTRWQEDGQFCYWQPNRTVLRTNTASTRWTTYVQSKRSWIALLIPKAAWQDHKAPGWSQLPVSHQTVRFLFSWLLSKLSNLFEKDNSNKISGWWSIVPCFNFQRIFLFFSFLFHFTVCWDRKLLWSRSALRL